LAKRFHFPLETLLRVRQLHEREAKRKVAAQRAEIARLEQLSAQTADEITSQQRELLVGQQQGRLDPLTLQRGRAWLTYLRHTLASQQAQRATLVRHLDELLAALRAARTQARIIAKLRERRWREYVRDRDRREQAAADELAQQLHGSTPL
jgi:flagellar export protein FliJ